MAVIVDDSGARMNQMLMNFFAQQEERKRERERLAQQDAQFQQSFGLEKSLADSQIAATNAGVTHQTETRNFDQQKYHAEQFFKNIYGPLVQAGRVEDATKAAQAYSQQNPFVGQTLKSMEFGRPATDLDTSAQNVAAFTKTQTGLAAGGSDDAQARNFTTKMATGEQLTAPAFGDQQQRAAGPQDYNRDVDVEGGRAPNANVTAQIAAQERMAREQNASAERMAGMRASAQGQPADVTANYQSERAQRIKSAVGDLLGRTDHTTVGLGAVTSKLPMTPARDYAADLKELTSNIAFSELQEMRAASKTGGALGSVAVRELELLESTLGGLDQYQGPENMRKNLNKVADKIAESLNRWDAAKAQTGGGASGGRQLDEGTARQFLQQAGGDPNKARALARQAGFIF
jgi:hypothetical protein